MTLPWQTARTIVVAVALGVVGLGIAGPAVANAAPPAPECFHFTMNNVPIRETPNGSSIAGHGQDGQLFVSSDPTPVQAGGKTWLPRRRPAQQRLGLGVHPQPHLGLLQLSPQVARVLVRTWATVWIGTSIPYRRDSL
ncbi:MAG TPA: hypothetical protein VH352_12700 [Pseudonocardiaceae bacterium]|jgi:hypothetical protein|nr:hypothetical protein [Pseudonocardiaceae bacterium]